jgi:hypothetical protein
MTRDPSTLLFVALLTLTAGLISGYLLRVSDEREDKAALLLRWRPKQVAAPDAICFTPSGQRVRP